MNTYRHYFNIDPEYFPAVNPDVIRHNPNLWKKFYPHPSFVRLLKDTVAVLSRKQKLNIWVDGAYGTGKSHAVLTLQHLLKLLRMRPKTILTSSSLTATSASSSQV